MLVLDASVGVALALAGDLPARLGGDDLIAPPLLWPEARSALRQLVHRGEVPAPEGRRARERLEAAPVPRREPDQLGARAWEIAEELGWAKTYDAEYLALADLAGARVVTLDGRLRRGADRLGLVVGLSEVAPRGS